MKKNQDFMIRCKVFSSKYSIRIYFHFIFIIHIFPMRKVDLNKKLKDKLSKKTIELASSIAKNVNVCFLFPDLLSGFYSIGLLYLFGCSYFLFRFMNLFLMVVV